MPWRNPAPLREALRSFVHASRKCKGSKRGLKENWAILSQYPNPLEAIPRREGAIQRLSRGIYTISDSPITANHSYAEAIKRVPRGIICLISALRYHGLTMQNPAEVWVAIPWGDWQPKSDGLRLRIVQFSGKVLRVGIEVHQVEGVKIAVTDVAQTIVDCFKFPNKIGTCLAVEALLDGRLKKRFTMEELWQYASVFRMSRVMMPYLETLT